MKSPVTAVTALALAIKHEAFTAPEIPLGHLSSALSHHTHAPGLCTRTPTQARTQAQRAVLKGWMEGPGRWFQQPLGLRMVSLGTRVGAQATFWSASLVAGVAPCALPKGSEVGHAM